MDKLKMPKSRRLAVAAVVVLLAALADFAAVRLAVFSRPPGAGPAASAEPPEALSAAATAS
ncbi:MAG: hypothetical protein LBU12_05000, partial [Deltaproteobacteria bacterium]|nr:hypothetical protein [Deltaproteobacteria bacterium]